MTEQDKKYVTETLEYALHKCIDVNGDAETHYNTLANAIEVVKNCSIPDVSGSAFTKEDLKKAYNNGSRQGSVNGMRVARGGEMNVTTFDEWYDQHYR